MWLLQKKVQNGEEYTREARARRGQLRNMDQSWPLEEAVVNLLCGPAAEKIVMAHLLELMPTATVDKDLKQVLDEVKKLQNSDSFRFAPSSLQSTVQTVNDMLTKIEQGGCPNLQIASATPLVRQVFARFGFFLRFSQGEGKPVLTAEAAMNVIASLLVAESHEAQHVQLVRTYKWLVAPSALSDVDSALAKHEADGGSSDVRTRVARPREAASSSGPTAKRRKKMADEARKLAEAAFD